MRFMVEELKKALELLPVGIQREIKIIAGMRRGGLDNLYEIRLRRGIGSNLVTGGGVLRLSSSVSAEDMERTLLLACEGAIYAHRDSISEG